MSNLAAAIQAALSSLNSHEVQQSATAHNIANAATTGFKRHDVQFTAMVHNGTGSGVQARVRVETTTPGTLISGNAPTDLAVSGKGFFTVQDSSGQTYLTRAGSFRADGNGVLRDASGRALMGYAGDGAGSSLQQIRIDPAAQSVSVGSNGKITVEGPDGTYRVDWTLPVGTVAAENGLSPVAGTGFSPTAASGAVNQQLSGKNGAGKLMPGMLESSNVNLVEEMTDLIGTTNAYSANTATIRTASEMMKTMLDIKS